MRLLNKYSHCAKATISIAYLFLLIYKSQYKFLSGRKGQYAQQDAKSY